MCYLGPKKKVNRLHSRCCGFLPQISHYFELFLVLVARFECQMSYLFHLEPHARERNHCHAVGFGTFGQCDESHSHSVQS